MLHYRGIFDTFFTRETYLSFSHSLFCILRLFCYCRNVVDTATRGVTQLKFSPGDVIQEWLWDTDVDSSIEQAIATFIGSDLVGEDYDGVADGAIVWWRDGDDEDGLSDSIMDASATLTDTSAPLWLLTPKSHREGAASPSTIQQAAKTAGRNPHRPLSLTEDWNAILLSPFGKM